MWTIKRCGHASFECSLCVCPYLLELVPVLRVGNNSICNAETLKPYVRCHDDAIGIQGMGRGIRGTYSNKIIDRMLFSVGPCRPFLYRMYAHKFACGGTLRAMSTALKFERCGKTKKISNLLLDLRLREYLIPKLPTFLHFCF